MAFQKRGTNAEWLEGGLLKLGRFGFQVPPPAFNVSVCS